MNQLPFLCIGAPGGTHVHYDFAACLWAMGRSYSPGRMGLAQAHSSIVAMGRNLCVAQAQEMKAEWLLFIDTDIAFPKDLPQRLLAHNEDVVCATYRRRGPPYDIQGHALYERDRKRLSGLVQMRYIPSGVLLIRMSVFTDMHQPYFRFETDEKHGIIRGEDFVFSDSLHERGLAMWCDLDTSHEIVHIHQAGLHFADEALDAHGEAMKAEMRKEMLHVQ